MSKIVREETPNHNELSIYHIAITFIGYISFYNALTELNKISKENNDRKGRNLQNFLCFANTAVLKDFSVALKEMYDYIETLNPGELQKHNLTEPRFNEFLTFIKKVKNNMKFHPSKKTMKKVLLSQKNKYPNIWGKLNKDVMYYCGYFLGNNVVFGSNWYLEYMFFEPKKVCKNDGDLMLFTNSIQTHMVSIFRTFETVLFNNNIDIPQIKIKQPKRFFQLDQQTMDSEKLFKKSKYDKLTTFLLILITEEIAGIQVYYDYYLDIEESTKNSLLLFFFTYILAIKYDEVRDCLEDLRDRSTELGVDSKYVEDFNKLGVFKKDITDFAYKLRNSYHHTEVAKYRIERDADEVGINIQMEDLYLMLTQSEKWPDDYVDMLNAMKEELNIIIQFCRKNVGISY